MTTTNTTYDDVFRTLLNDCPNLIIPVVNEIFYEDYTGLEKIELSQNELFFQQLDGKDAERITDSSFVIIRDGKRKKRYHIECQSTPDGSMVIRMFEYDTLVAIRSGEQTKEGLVVRFPSSAVLYLRHTKTTPDKLTIRMETPGGNVSYTVPILKVKTYSIEEIFDKKLLFLIPFYIFSYEKDFNKIANSNERLGVLRDEYISIRKRLNKMCENGTINEYEKRTIIRMTNNVINSLAEKYEVIRKGVTDSMGGKVLEYEEKDILNRGKREGLKEGKRIFISNMLKRNIPDEDICALGECDLDFVNEVRNTMM